MKTTLSFKIDPKIKNAILKLAEKENRSLSNYVVTVLIRHLDEKRIDWKNLKQSKWSYLDKTGRFHGRRTWMENQARPNQQKITSAQTWMENC